MFSRLLLAIGLLIVTGAASAQAQMLCMPREAMADKLRQTYREYPVGIGVESRQTGVVELWVSETGTFTVTVTRTNKMSCIVAAGDGWVSRSLEPGEDL